MSQFTEVKAIQLALDIGGKQRVLKVYINSKGDWTNSCRKSYQMLLKKDCKCRYKLYEHTTIYTQIYYKYLNEHLAKANNLNSAWS